MFLVTDHEEGGVYGAKRGTMDHYPADFKDAIIGKMTASGGRSSAPTGTPGSPGRIV
ncbi:MAG: hypothetical protein AB1798_06500 [Spirochaetota bacterium]